MNSLATKLSLAFIAVVVIGVASVSLLVRWETARSFSSYLEAGGAAFASRAVDGLAQLYRQEGGWQNAQALLDALARGPSDRLVLANASGTIVADTEGELAGQSASAVQRSASYPVEVGGRRVGTLYLVSFTPGAGMGQGRGPMGGAGRERPAEAGPPGPQAASSLESRFLGSVDRAILVAALFSGLIAIAVGLLAARRITSPLAELSGAARNVASGKLEHRVKVSSGDELGQVGRAFNTMAESLDRNEQARRRLVADIAHDLRTPLTVIEGTVDGMLDGVFDLDRANLESVKEEVGLLTKMVADLRTLSLAEAGQLKLDREMTDPGELARRSIARVEPIARRKGITCRQEIGEALPEVNVDPARIAQVLANLLDNAIRHTPAGGQISLRVDMANKVGGCSPGGERAAGTTAGGDAARRWVALVVTDTGEGIAPEAVPYLFDRFYRADESRTRKRGGSGLGLAIVKQLVEAHGGRVCAESQVGTGSRFVVELPAQT